MGRRQNRKAKNEPHQRTKLARTPNFCKREAKLKNIRVNMRVSDSWQFHWMAIFAIKLLETFSFSFSFVGARCLCPNRIVCNVLAVPRVTLGEHSWTDLSIDRAYSVENSNDDDWNDWMEGNRKVALFPSNQYQILFISDVWSRVEGCFANAFTSNTIELNSYTPYECICAGYKRSLTL